MPANSVGQVPSFTPMHSRHRSVRAMEHQHHPRKCWWSCKGVWGGRCLCGRRPHPEACRLHVDFRLNRQRVQLVLMRVLAPVSGSNLSGIKTNANMPYTTATATTTTRSRPSDRLRFCLAIFIFSLSLSLSLCTWRDVG